MRIHTFSLPYESREIGRRYMREGGDGASSQELFLNKPVSRGSKIAEVEVRMELDRFVELFCIALKRGKVSVWHAKVHGKIVEGRSGRVAQKYWKGREEGKRAPALDKLYCPLSPSFALPSLATPSKCFAEQRVRQRIPSHGNVSPLKTFGISRIIVRAFLSSSETKRIQQCRIRITS